MSDTKKVMDILLKALKDLKELKDLPEKLKELRQLPEKLKEYIDCAVPRVVLRQTSIFFVSLVAFIVSMGVIISIFVGEDISKLKDETANIKVGIVKLEGILKTELSAIKKALKIDRSPDSPSQAYDIKD